MDAHELPTKPLAVNVLELSFLVHATWEPAKYGDVIARDLLKKVKALAAEFGVDVKILEPQ